MLLLPAPRPELEGLLRLVALELELSSAQYANAISAYWSILKWLSAPDSSLASWHPTIYPQGSFPLLTTNRPYLREQYDLDIVCEFPVASWTVSPLELYTMLYKRLAENVRFKSILEKKNRCVRLNYSEEFHVDIIAACCDRARGTNCIAVPDRTARAWSPSNPKGFAQWFEDRQGIPLHAEAMEPLPPIPLPEKSALQRAVQLIKRQHQKEYGPAPASIVITTLAADAYAGESSISGAIAAYLDRTPKLIEAAFPHAIQVVNPSNNIEVFSEQWNSSLDAYHSFCSDLRTFQAKWTELLQAPTVRDMIGLLQHLFGVEVIREDPIPPVRDGRFSLSHSYKGVGRALNTRPRLV